MDLYDEVRLSQKNYQRIKKLHQQAALQGRGQRYLIALGAIQNRLREDPKNSGEPLYRLPALKQMVYEAIVSPIVISYAVHEEKPLVFLKGVQLLS